MKLFFLKIIIFISLASCSNINFLLETNDGSDFLKNKTDVSVGDWDNPVLKEVLFLKLGETLDRQFLLTTKVNEKQTKRFVGENQVAQKIDYKITINYTLINSTKKCPNIVKAQTSSFSFTPKSSGYNFASDILLQNLFEEAVLDNVNNFISFANNKLKSYSCLDEN